MPAFPFTLRQLEVFANLCGTRSFRRTAESLGISQASVSNQMKVLEDQLGVALFVRRPGQRPTLTPEGMAFLDDLKAFQTAGEALASHRRKDPEELPAIRFRVLIGQGLLDNYIRPKLDRFFAAHPQIELTFEAHPPSKELARDVEDGRFDFALIHQRADRPVEPHLRQLALVRGGIYGHRKFAEGRRLPLSSEFVNMLPFIMPLAASSQEREILRLFERYGIAPRRVIGHTQYYDVMAAMLERGVGVASFADTILPAEMRDEVIQLHPLENWRLLWYRKDGGIDPRYDAVQVFLFSSVLQNPDYRTISVFAEEYA
ncbi:LysR family transcriptional regulator [Croceibacterium sp. LX-88]|uniref:LysR family transcriptional regulator n=1 Tax=Croceibacterium selenioxidans TaxID=2838833 RepID=A0ABS5W0W1_9SPHN|nr:LysR family transcriptional regulator [Croceibacterium selenioxidans]MBT2133279.1 LysR family transcriptional regulator [Croceibacterium selenioxidans]